ncbi:DUF6480 family protein [Nocardia sp. NPDC024068]|uniref:DUF6480 family protein n=1 Tax=Nocardia sp. NPDC024068 TaxID=3157197 RepID=UPI00340E34E8
MADNPAQDPGPARDPDLEPGGGVTPGATPPETPQTSGLSAPEPRTSNRFPPTGTLAIILTLLLVALVAAVAVGLVVVAVGG